MVPHHGATAHLTAAAAISGMAFVERLRRKIPKRVGGETNARAWRKLLSFEEVARAVESVKGEAWKDFGDLRGDWRRYLALRIGRMRCGLTLQEIGKQTGGLSVPAVAKAVERMAKRLKNRQSRSAVIHAGLATTQQVASRPHGCAANKPRGNWVLRQRYDQDYD